MTPSDNILAKASITHSSIETNGSNSDESMHSPQRDELNKISFPQQPSKAYRLSRCLSLQAPSSTKHSRRQSLVYFEKDVKFHESRGKSRVRAFDMSFNPRVSSPYIPYATVYRARGSLGAVVEYKSSYRSRSRRGSVDNDRASKDDVFKIAW